MRGLDPGFWGSESTCWNHQKKIWGGSSGKAQDRSKQESEDLLHSHFPPQVPQAVACAEDSNEAGKGTGLRSREQHLEKLRLFGPEKTQRDSGFLLRPQKVRESRRGPDGPWKQSWGPEVEVTGRQSSARRKKKTLGHSMDESNCLAALLQVLKMDAQEVNE